MDGKEICVRKIADTQSNYRLVRKNITQQCSYNLPIESEEILLIALSSIKIHFSFIFF